MSGPEQKEVAQSPQITLPIERGRERWSWKRALQGAKYGFIFGVGGYALSLLLTSLEKNISADILGVATSIYSFS